MTTTFPLSTHLAILQQAEYEIPTYLDWVRAERQDSEVLDHLMELEPERWTRKLRFIRRVAKILHLILPTESAVVISTRLFQPSQKLATFSIVWRAKRKLRSLQKRGLTTVAVAGSYGKTSVKFATTQVISQHAYTLTTPASHNTPLSIAQTILRSLTAEHRFFVIEFGEFTPDDIADFLEFLRPNYGILTPIGFSHLARFGNEKTLVANFQHFFSSKWAPKKVWVDSHNKSYFSAHKNIDWYGGENDKRLRLEQFEPNIEGSKIKLSHYQEKYTLSVPALSPHQITNCFPGMLLLEELGYDLLPSIHLLEYLPTPERRLELHHNANGTIVVDNSYNTSPGSWAEMAELLEQIKPKPLAIVTAGFVELDEKTAKSAHQKMAPELLELADTIGVVKTRDNRTLIETLQEKKNRQSIIVGVNQMDILNQIALLNRPVKYIWLEGGVRELYQ